MKTIESVLVTGANGFVGRRLSERLGTEGIATLPITRSSGHADWRSAAEQADAIVHLAGVTQSDDPSAHLAGNLNTTQRLSAVVAECGRAIPVLYASTVKADDPTDYGRTKKAGEAALRALSDSTGSPVGIYRLPHIFGPGSKPDHNSIVATLCHRYARGESVVLQNPAGVLRLLFIDDLINIIVADVAAPQSGTRFLEVGPIHITTVGEAAETLAEIMRTGSGYHHAGSPSSLRKALQVTIDSFQGLQPANS